MVKLQAMLKSVITRSKGVSVNSQVVEPHLVCDCSSTLKSYLESEFAFHPPSIFDAISVRKKSPLMKVLEKGVVDELNVSDTAVILDGFILRALDKKLYF